MFVCSETGPMDRFGYFNYGAANTCTRSAIENAKLVILEINESMPRCLGGYDEAVHISEVDYIVETDNTPPFSIPDPVTTETDRMIAELVVNEMKDGKLYPAWHRRNAKCHRENDC